MATGQTLLNLLEVLHPELQLQAGENDVTKGLLAINMAQDYMENLFALQPDFMGDTTGTVTTTQNVETTTFPSGLLRLDKLQLLDPATSKPVADLDDIRKTGGHVVAVLRPPLISSSAAASGGPVGYWTDGRNIYWLPLPDGTYSVRYYGFVSAGDITAGSTYTYPDATMLPLVTMAARIVRTGLDDDVSQYQKLAQETFTPVITMLGNFQRERAPGFIYRYVHNT